MPKKKMTIEQLARLTAKGFEETASKKDIVGMKKDIAGLKGDVAGLKGDVADIKREMVTKSFLEDKLADLECKACLA